jgi:alkylation response protein AidB-like acyl-CoA dehydrogenase
MTHSNEDDRAILDAIEVWVEKSLRPAAKRFDHADAYPHEIVEEEKKRFYFRFNCDEENPHYKKAIAQVERMHSASALVPEYQRIKCFTFQRNDDFIDTLRSRVEIARKIYATLTLIGGNDE